MKRLQLFPDTTRVVHEHLTIAGCDLDALAGQHGTPLYLYDRATLDSAAQTFQRSLAGNYPGRATVTYAGKAYLGLAIAQWTQTLSLWVDCTGQGEMAVAMAGGVPRERLLVHGVAKTRDDLIAAIRHAGTLVVDHISELEQLIEIAGAAGLPELWLRLQPGTAVAAHAYTQTGQAGSKFGMNPEQWIQAADFCRRHHLPLRGIHFHQGSQFRDPAPLRGAIETALDLIKEVGLEAEWHLSPGGGWGVAYHEDELPHPPPEEYVRFVTRGVVEGCAARRLTLPHLHLEPGRTLVARAGVALYRVQAVKQMDGRRWLLVDGGMADNPRRALYGARYSALPVTAVEREPSGPAWIAGPYCESGDVLIEDLPFPAVGAGELIAVPMSGAYQLAMASNYNGARRPEVLMLEGGRARVMQRRETLDDLLGRDQPLFP